MTDQPKGGPPVELTCREPKNIASDIRSMLRDDAHLNPKYAEGHKRVLLMCAEDCEAVQRELDNLRSAPTHSEPTDSGDAEPDVAPCTTADRTRDETDADIAWWRVKWSEMRDERDAAAARVRVLEEEKVKLCAVITSDSGYEECPCGGWRFDKLTRCFEPLSPSPPPEDPKP